MEVSGVRHKHMAAVVAGFYTCVGKGWFDECVVSALLIYAL